MYNAVKAIEVLRDHGADMLPSHWVPSRYTENPAVKRMLLVAQADAKRQRKRAAEEWESADARTHAEREAEAKAEREAFSETEEGPAPQRCASWGRVPQGPPAGKYKPQTLLFHPDKNTNPRCTANANKKFHELQSLFGR